ncbi:NAD(P)/FAD-dependent oxidoreductase [Polluticaenibacter yanchengensis]|uniref:FAD-binding protein n=1 Tax=Polluticaenibacter yanchengensis TaxID=3014562 RepID=A0ABT4UQ49_9BACT|nr:FAD-binding protein [Chitinophagaceae bacterium LY-5]
MQKDFVLKLPASEAGSGHLVQERIAQEAGVPVTAVTGFHILKQSLDARSRTIWTNLTVKAFINEPFVPRSKSFYSFKDVTRARHEVVIIGAGPAGLYAALRCIELGIKPIVLERGKDVRARRRDLAMLNRTGEVNPESNYCFGEGGAGTYSDGKLYTRSNKRGNIDRILQLFVQFGAEEKILYQAHPHIGTNKLPHIISAMRDQVIDAGGQILFETKLVDFGVENNTIKSVITAGGDVINAKHVILATGHSARDIFRLLDRKKILIEAKPFALGVRVEHPQSVIDAAQYKCDVRADFLPPASYSLVQQVNERGVFSFCMCPGGIIAPAATDPGELVVNGWSPSKRNNEFANSGMVVQVDLQDALPFITREQAKSPLALMYFQQVVEQTAFTAGGGKFVAPAQRLVDFCNNKTSNTLPECSYIPGISSQDLTKVLPPFIYKTLQGGLKAFGKKMNGYYTNDAILVATESRTSSPVRIPRDAETLEHVQVSGLYPCAEGSGYAGGIVSAAMDGERVVDAIARKIGVLA